MQTLKERAQHVMRKGSIEDYENFVQEIANAPTPEPFGYFKAEPFGWTDCAETDDGAIALFAAPPAPSVPVEPMENIALNEWLDKTEWVQKELNTFPVSSLGMHRADVMRLEIDRLRKLLSAAPTPAEPPADLDAPEFSDGCEKEGFPGGCARMGCCKQLPATANPARTGSSQIEPPSVPDEQLQAAFDRGFKAGNEQGIAQQIEIHKLHDLLAAPTPAEAPADLVQDSVASEPVGYLYTNLQSGEYHVSDVDDDYRGPERALWCIEPVYRRARGQS